MDIESAKRLMDIMVENASRILRAGFGLNYAGSTLFEVVDLLRSNPSLKDEFLVRVEAAMKSLGAANLDAGALPRELIELVAHEMRWKEILEYAEDRVQARFYGDRSLAIGDIATSIVDAYKDDWPDREFYEHYRR